MYSYITGINRVSHFEEVIHYGKCVQMFLLFNKLHKMTYRFIGLYKCLVSVTLFENFLKD